MASSPGVSPRLSGGAPYQGDCSVFYPRQVFQFFNLSIYLSIYLSFTYIPVTQMVKNLPTMQEIQVRSLGQEDPLEEGMATRSSVLPWRIPWTEEPGRLQSVGSQRVGYD